MSVNFSTIETSNSLAVDLVGLERLISEFRRTGLVLVRGYQFDPESFASLTNAICDRFHALAVRYSQRLNMGASHTTKIIQRNMNLLGHSEARYTPFLPAPEVGFFMCTVPPSSEGGETLLIDGVEFLHRLPADLRNRFVTGGLIYEMLWPRERWQNELQVRDMPELRNRLSGLKNVRFDIRGESLHLFFNSTAVSKTRQGEDAFVNGLLAHLPHIDHPRYEQQDVYVNPTNKMHFGNGEQLSNAVINQLIDIHDDLRHLHRWQAGDMLMFDNTRFLHGRVISRTDCERAIYSRFGWLRSVQ